jgi:hypothetical protein
MHMPATVTSAIFLVSSWLIPVMTGEESGTQRAETLTNYGLDPSTALGSRIGETPAAVLKEFKDAGATPTSHIMIIGLDQKMLEALNHDGSNGESYVNHLPVHHTELFLVMPIREWDDAQAVHTVGAATR